MKRIYLLTFICLFFLHHTSIHAATVVSLDFDLTASNPALTGTGSTQSGTELDFSATAAAPNGSTLSGLLKLTSNVNFISANNTGTGALNSTLSDTFNNSITFSTPDSFSSDGGEDVLFIGYSLLELSSLDSGDTYDLTFGGTTTSGTTSPIDLSGSLPENFTITATNNDFQISRLVARFSVDTGAVAVPEPKTWMGIGLLLICGLIVRNRTAAANYFLPRKTESN